MPKTILDQMAIELVGDGKTPFYFLSVNGKVISITTRKDVAIIAYESEVDKERCKSKKDRHEVMLENKHGSVADYQKREDSDVWEDIRW